MNWYHFVFWILQNGADKTKLYDSERVDFEDLYDTDADNID